MTDKSAAAVREFCERWSQEWNENTGWYKSQIMYDKMLPDLTALISEGYVSKEEHESIANMAEALKTDMDAAKMELALMRKFILWTGENCQYYPDVNEWVYFESPMTQRYFKETDELFNYWEENEG